MLLDEARDRTLRLVEPVSDADLDRVHDPLMSPLVWDLGHIAAYEDLWVCHRTGGLDLLRPDLAELYDAFETPRSKRGEIPYLRRHDALDYMEAVRERSLEVLAATGPDHHVWQLVAQHEHQHDETMLQTLQLADKGAFAPEPGDASGRRSERARMAVPGGAFELGDGGHGFVYDNERPRHARRARGVHDRPLAGHERGLSRLRGGRRLPPARAVERARAGRTGSARAGSARSTGPPTAASAASTASWSSSRSCP